MYYTLMGLTLLSTPSSYLIVNCLYFSRWSFYYLKKNPYCCAFSVILWKEEPLKLPCLVSHYTCPNTLPTHTHTHTSANSHFPCTAFSNVSPFHVHAAVSSTRFCTPNVPPSSLTFSRSWCQWHHTHVAPLPYLRAAGERKRWRRQG